VYKKLQDGAHYYDKMFGVRILTAVAGQSTPEFQNGGMAGRKDVAITDVRFKNEVHGLRKHGAHLIRVVRRQAGLKGSAGQHRSETEQRDMPDSLFDRVIVNDGTLDDLKARVVEFMRSIT
jgi:hypothetical protein